MPLDATPKQFRLIDDYATELERLMRKYAKRGLDYVQIERGTMQAIFQINWEYNTEAVIESKSYIDELKRRKK